MPADEPEDYGELMTLPLDLEGFEYDCESATRVEENFTESQM